MRKEREVYAKRIFEANRAVYHIGYLFKRGLITEREAAREKSKRMLLMTLYEAMFLDTYIRCAEEGRPEFAENLGTYEDNMDSWERVNKGFKKWKRERMEAGR